MKFQTYIYAEKNGSGSLVLSAVDDDEAYDMLKERVKYPELWRLDSIEDE